MASEQEMIADLATADAAGDTALAQHIAGQIKALKAQPPPGILDKAKAAGSAALQWATTPFKGMQDLVNEHRQQAEAGGPPLINRMLGVSEQNEPGVLTGAKKFVSGLPGYQPSSQTSAGEAKGEQFGKEHPILKYALPLAAGFANPVIPGQVKELPAAPNILRRAAQATVTPTPEAAMLQAKGVPLTMGQLNPRSAVGQIEEASTSLRGVGAGISGQRDAAKKAWQQLALGEAHPPGMPQVPPDWKLHDALSAIYEGFRPSYEAIGNDMIYPAIHGEGGGPLQSLGKQAGAMERAALDPSVLAPDATRQSVNSFLQHQMTIIPQRTGAVGQVGVSDLLQVRSNIRDAIRSAVKSGNHDVAQLLSNGEDAITKAVESQAKPAVLDALRQTDAKYHAYKVIEDAISRAGDSPSGFSPSQLGQSIKASMGKGQFARGGGGDLRELSRAGKAVFESVSPPTGARLLTVGPLGEWGTGPAAFMANRPPRVPMSFLTPEQRMTGGLSLEALLAAIRNRGGNTPGYTTQGPAIASQ